MRVAVLMGGPAPEHDVSIASGRAVHAALRGAGRDVLAVLVTRAGRFVIADEVDDFDPELAVHAAGFLEAMRKRDVAALFLALHGQGGEDGSIQAFLDWAGLPYTGAGFEASAVAMNKLLFKALIVEAGLPTPRHLSCSRHQHVTDPEALLVRARGLGLLPGFIKVANAGSSYGVHLVRDEDEARRALAEVFRGDGQLIWEERIAGREFTVPLCGEPEGEIEILPILEIRPKKGAFFDLASKYDDGGADEICPAPIDEALAGELRRLAVAVHRLLGLRGLSRTDFMVGEAGPMILETNTIPGLTAASLVPKALAAAGHDPADFYWSQLEAARARRRPFGG